MVLGIGNNYHERSVVPQFCKNINIETQITNFSYPKENSAVQSNTSKLTVDSCNSGYNYDSGFKSNNINSASLILTYSNYLKLTFKNYAHRLNKFLKNEICTRAP